MELDGWQDVRFEEIGLAFSFPRSTAHGQRVELDEVRLHAQSEDGAEVYFELSRHLGGTAAAISEREREFLVARFGAEVSALSATTLASRPAQQFSAEWGDTVRRFVFAEAGGWVYRFVYDPRSQLNAQVLDSIRIDQVRAPRVTRASRTRP